MIAATCIETLDQHAGAIIREIATKDSAGRLRKVERGKFELAR